jgi:glycosyltransferase involved in cell wall biosynthesis
MRTNLQHRHIETDRQGQTGAVVIRHRIKASRQPKSVLVVSSHFPPERAAGVHRILRTVKQLCASKWPVAVLTVDPRFYRAGTPLDDHLLGRLPDGIYVHRAKVLRGLTALAHWRRRMRQSVTGKMRRWLRGWIGSASAPAAPVSTAHKPVSTKRPYVDSEIGWFLPAIREGRKVIAQHNPDIIFSSAPPFTCHLVAGWLARRHGIRWVADFRDPWARSPWKRADLTDPWKLRLREWLERLVIERADAVILNTEALREEFAEYYGPRLALKFHTITNGYDAETLMPILRGGPLFRNPRAGSLEHDPASVRRALKPSSRLVLTHAGSLYRQRDPRPLVRALASAIRKGRIAADAIDLNFIGTVAPQFGLADTIRELQLESSVRMTPPVPHQQCMQCLLESDVLIVIQPGTRLQVPVKLYEYMPFRKPILALAPSGALTAIAEGSGLGVVVDPEDEAGIEAALCDFYDNRDRLADRFRADVDYIARFDGEAVSRQLQRILEELP